MGYANKNAALRRRWRFVASESRSAGATQVFAISVHSSDAAAIDIDVVAAATQAGEADETEQADPAVVAIILGARRFGAT